MAYIYDTKIRVEYVDTDKMGVVHNSNYFRFFERGRCEAMRNIGIGYKDIETSGVSMPVIEQYSKYLLPAYYDDELIVRTIVEKSPLAKMRFDYQILRQKAGKEELLCWGFNVLAFTDMASNRPKACPDWVLEKLSKVL